MTNKLAVIKVTLILLKNIMSLPNDIKITRLRQSWEQERDGVFEMLAEGESLPEVMEGQAIPEARIIVHLNYCDKCNRSVIGSSEVKVY